MTGLRHIYRNQTAETEKSLGLRGSSEEMSQLSCERSIPIVPDFLQCGCLGLRDHSDLVSEGNEFLRMNM